MKNIPITYYLICLLSSFARLFIKKNWKLKGLEKKSLVEALIPREWLLPLSITSNISETTLTNVTEIPKQCGLLDELELDITENYTATQLLKKLHDGTFTAVQVTEAFCKRAAIAHQLINCCTEFMFDAAIKRANELDEYFKVNGKVIGPLHGLPISLKDTFNIPGFDSTIGFVSYIGNNKNITQYSDMVKLLLDLGAVIYVKTNVPQTLMTPDTDNHVMGRTLNPLNTSLTAGGSSGGEGGLIKLRGSILGVGTDVGGSLRIPLLCCGIYSFKPTTNRLPYANQTTPGLGDKKLFGIQPVLGPMANSFKDLELFVKNVLVLKPWMYDSEVLAMPYRAVDIQRKLRIGVIVEDKDFPVHPPIKRCLMELADKLSQHEIIVIDKFPSYLEMWKCCLKYFVLDSNFDTARDIWSSGEPPIDSLSTNKMEEFGLPPFTIDGISQMISTRKQLTADWNQVFIDNDLDVILSPAAPSTAPPHDTFGATPYTAAWNLTDFPCCMIPFGKVEDIDQIDVLKNSGKNYSHLYADYNQTEFMGGECHLQLMCRRYEEEKLLSIGKIIDLELQL